MLPAGELLRLGAWEFSVVQGVLFAENSLEASPIVPPVAPRPSPPLVLSGRAASLTPY